MLFIVKKTAGIANSYLHESGQTVQTKMAG